MAIATVCKEAGLQLVYSSNLIKGRYTQGAVAGQSVEDTLHELLKGSGLAFEFVNPNTVTLVRTRHEETDDSRWGRGSHNSLSLAQIYVTGSQSSEGSLVGNQVITIQPDELEYRGHTSVVDVLRTLPQIFTRGPTDDTKIGGSHGLETVNNESFATGVNLRGLGAGSTLVLVNGRRIAPGSADGRFVDLSAIPISAIDRIEVVPDGASASYGADAIGGVVNFVLKSSDDAKTLVQSGSAKNGPAESLVSQVLGTSWEHGKGMLSLEVSVRDALRAVDRSATARSDLTAYGGDNWDTNEGNPGTIVVDGRSFAIPKGQDGRSLKPGDLTAGTENKHNRNEFRDAIPRHERRSAVGTAYHDLGENAQLFAEALFSKRTTLMLNPGVGRPIVVPKENAFFVDPSRQNQDSVVVLYNFARDLGPERDEIKALTSNLTVGISAELRNSWRTSLQVTRGVSDYRAVADGFVKQAALETALADDDPGTAFNPFGDGSFTPEETLKSIRDYVLLTSRANTWTIHSTAQGTLLNWFDRPVQAALGADYSNYSLDSGSQIGGLPQGPTRLDRDAKAVYAEVLLPVLKHLHFSMAGRAERYSQSKTVTTPRAALEWKPTSNLGVRATMSKSFKPPDLIDLDESANGIALDLRRDPLSAEGSSLVLLSYGNNADLGPQRATSWTLGTDYRLASKGFWGALTYFNIVSRGRIEFVDYDTPFLQSPDYSEVVTRNPTSEQRAAFCARATFAGKASDCLTLPVAALIDMRLKNVAEMKTKGIDILAAREMQSWLGRFEGSINATYLFNFKKAKFSSAGPTELLSTQTNPIDFRMRASLSWARHGFGLAASLNYVDNYRDIASFPERRVPSWSTIDLNASYGATPDDPTRLQGLVVTLNADNAFDRNPPFLNNRDGIGYDPENADVLGRMISLRVSKHW
jgi:outer membrane receptor protein involved in Fe transport